MAESVRDDKGIRQNLVDKCRICGGIVNLKVCAKCKTVAYCSKEHQKQDWKSHKELCKKLASDTSRADSSKTNDRCKQMSIHMVDVTKKLGGLSIDSQDEVSEVTSGKKRVVADDTVLCQQQSSEKDEAQTLFVNNGDSKRGREMYTHATEESTDINSDSTEEAQTSEDCHVSKSESPDINETLPSSSSDPDLTAQAVESGSSEKFILESEEATLQAPDYKKKESEATSSSKMPYLSVVESRNKALSEYVSKCLNAYGVCVIDNFLGNDKGTDILDEVHDLYDNGDLSSGQLVNASSPKGVVRGDVITWVDGSEMGCSNVNFLISSIDAIMLHCQRTLGHYNIKGRSKAMVAVYPGNATHFLRHVDNPSGDGRCVTCIYYLNKNWNSKTDGGLLRIFPEGANRVANVEPKFDRLLFFWSDRRNPHEVLPAFRTRYAVTVWYYDEQERRRAVKKFKGKTEAKTKEMVPLQALTEKKACT